MVKLSKKYPQYGFEKHMGYGTKFHLVKIKELGITKYHRKSFIHE
jgi:ribonuclease HII